MRREEATWLVVEFLLLAVGSCDAEEPRGGAEGLARSLQKKVRCSPAGLSAFECVQCLSHESLADLPGWNSSSQTREGWQREQLSVLLLERLSDLSRPCNAGSERCDSYAECRATLRLETPGAGERLARLEHILRRVKAVYVPTRKHKCFTAEDVLDSIVPYEKDQVAYVEKVAAAVITHLSQGHCIEVGDAVTDFLEDLFKRYGDNTTEVMTQQGLERLLKKLRLASDDIANGHSHGHVHDDDHDHGSDDHSHGHSHDDHDHGHDHPHNHDHSHDGHTHDHSEDHDHSHDHNHHAHDEQHSHEHSTRDSHQSNATTTDQTSTPPALSTSTSGHTHRSSGAGKSTHDHSEHHEGHDHFEEHVDPDDDHEEDKVDRQRQHQPGVQAPGKKQSEQPALSRRRRSVPQGPELDSHNHTSSALKCWSTRELIRQFGRSENGTISRHEFFHLCPALIQQAVSDVCRQGTQDTHKPTTAELYGYGTLSVFIISLCSLMGVLLLPCLARHAYYYIMMGFIGLSFGTMTGDALLHLIPQVLGLHSHDGGHEEGGHSHHHHDEDGLVPSYMWKQLGLIGAIYGLFVFEALSTIFGSDENEGHGHSHLPKNIPGDLHMTKVSSKTESNVELAHCSSTPSLAAEESPQAPVFKSRSLCCGMSTLAAMVIIGGAIHNVADGLAIGAAFSSGLKGGISTSLAVFCHELPHEFGDFVVLISTGLGYRRALFLNFMSALAAFGGLYAGFLLGEEAAARDWILTVTAGIFLYVALVDMLPELKQYKGKSPFKMFIVKNVGVLAGIAFMCVIAIYEDKLNI